MLVLFKLLIPLLISALGPACGLIGRIVLVVVIGAAALTYLAICLGQALEAAALSQEQPIGKREVTDRDPAWTGQQGGL